MRIYIVRPGDTVDAIAISQSVSAQSIIYDNQLSYPFPLVVGQALLLEDASSDLNTPEQISSENAYSAYVGG